MIFISGCEAADVSSPMEMAVEVVNGNISYNSPLEETIRIHLHYQPGTSHQATSSHHTATGARGGLAPQGDHAAPGEAGGGGGGGDTPKSGASRQHEPTLTLPSG